jgi:hypothetical protein
VQNQLYCYLMSLNCAHFEYEACLFSKSHMSRIDPGDSRKGLTAEGSGRVSTYLKYNVIHSYTIECNYNTSRVGNEVPPTSENPDGILDDSVGSSFTPNPEKYAWHHWESVGRASIIAMLDIRGINPCSRIPKSRYRSLEKVRDVVSTEVRNRSDCQGALQKKSNGVHSHRITAGGANHSIGTIWRACAGEAHDSSCGLEPVKPSSHDTKAGREGKPGARRPVAGRSQTCIALGKPETDALNANIVSRRSTSPSPAPNRPAPGQIFKGISGKPSTGASDKEKKSQRLGLPSNGTIAIEKPPKNSTRNGRYLVPREGKQFSQLSHQSTAPPLHQGRAIVESILPELPKQKHNDTRGSLSIASAHNDLRRVAISRPAPFPPPRGPSESSSLYAANRSRLQSMNHLQQPKKLIKGTVTTWATRSAASGNVVSKLTGFLGGEGSKGR